MLEPKWAISMGACCSSMGVFNNYALVPADKFMPVDVHVPGCPPRPEALMHGILKLRKLVQDNPDRGWRERHGAAGTGASVRRVARSALTCLTPRAWSCSPATWGTRRSRPCTSANAPRWWWTRLRIRSVLQDLRERGYAFLASVHGVDHYPQEPRLGVVLQAAGHEQGHHLTVKLRVPSQGPTVESVSGGLADRGPSGARGVRHVRRRVRGASRLRRILMPGLRGAPAAPGLPARRRT